MLPFWILIEFAATGKRILGKSIHHCDAFLTRRRRLMLTGRARSQGAEDEGLARPTDWTIPAKRFTIDRRSFLHAMPILHVAEPMFVGKNRIPGTLMQRSAEGTRLTPNPARTPDAPQVRSPSTTAARGCAIRVSCSADAAGLNPRPSAPQSASAVLRRSSGSQQAALRNRYPR